MTMRNDHLLVFQWRRLLREREPSRNNVSFVAVEIIWRSLVLCGWRVQLRAASRHCLVDGACGNTKRTQHGTVLEVLHITRTDTAAACASVRDFVIPSSSLAIRQPVESGNWRTQNESFYFYFCFLQQMNFTICLNISATFTLPGERNTSICIFSRPGMIRFVLLWSTTVPNNAFQLPKTQGAKMTPVQSKLFPK